MYLQKRITFLYINNGTFKNKEKITPFTIALKIIKHLGIHLAKEVKNLYNENYKILLKEIEEDINKWKDIPVHGLE